MVRTVAIVVLAGLLLVAVLVAGVAVWWAMNVVATAESRLAVERQNVEQLQAYTQSLYEELVRLRAESAKLRAGREALQPSRETMRETRR